MTGEELVYFLGSKGLLKEEILPESTLIFSVGDVEVSDDVVDQELMLFDVFDCHGDNILYKPGDIVYRHENEEDEEYCF